MSAAISTSRALAICRMFTNEMFLLPRSTLLMYVRWRPANSASFSCEIPMRSRMARSCSPNLT